MMSTCSRMARTSVLIALFVPASGSAILAATGTVEKMRYSVQGGKTRVVIDCSRRFSYEVVPFHKPERIAINLMHVKIRGKVRDSRISGGAVKGIRINRLSWGSQIVLDLRRKAEWKHFVLDRAKGKLDRIVIDVWASKDAGGMHAGQTWPVIIAVDAGHGGIDPGATGKYNLVEKHVALDIARRLARVINQKKGYRALLTRRTDVFLSLEKRTQVAKEKGADAFVSIHLNSAKKKKARGAEVFFLSPSGAAAKASKLLTNKKETARELGLMSQRSDEVLYMILDVNQQTMMLRSSLLAESILKSLRGKGLPPTRGIKQRSFAVLKTISMPSIIVEVGFVSNAHDAKLLKTNKGRENIAALIAKGITSFFSHYPPPRGEKKNVIVHKVRKGDTLWRISRKYDTTVASLRRVNKLGKATDLRIGQEILILEGN